jgi:alkyl hydroperoxide reductase subunit AhpC
MSLRLGDEAPNFKAQTTIGEIDFHDYIKDSWVVFFSHPSDYTPVCTTELGRTAKLKSEFDKRGVKAIALSVDNVNDHLNWIKDINETQNTEVNFPVIADEDHHVSELYDMIHPNASATVTVRSVFI